MSNIKDHSEVKRDSMDGQLKEQLYQEMKGHILAITGISRALGHKELTTDFQRTIANLKAKEEPK